MAKYYLINAVRYGDVTAGPGSPVDDLSDNVATIQSAGGILIGQTEPGIAAAAANATIAKKQGNIAEAARIMAAAYVAAGGVDLSAAIAAAVGVETSRAEMAEAGISAAALTIGTTVGTAFDGAAGAALAAAAAGPFVYILDSSADPSIAHYYQLTPDFSYVPGSQVTATAAYTSGALPQTIQFAVGGNVVAWISQTAVGSNFIQQGEWATDIYAAASNPVSTTNIKVSVYTRDTNGTETHQFDITGPRVTPSTATEESEDATLAQYACNPTDRIVVKIFAVFSGTGTATTATLYFQGSAAASHIHTPLEASIAGALPVATGNSNGLMSAPDKAKSDHIVLVGADTEISIPNGATTSGTTYTVPAGKLLDLEKVLIVLDTPITGAGTCVVSVGVSASDQSYLLNVSLTSASSVGVQAGVTLLSLGAAMLAKQGFESVLAAASAIVWQCVTTGVITAGTVRVIAKGLLL